MVADVPREVAESFLKGQSHPFIIPKVLVEQIPEELWLLDEARDVLIAPLDWDPDGFGALVIVAESGRDAFDDRDLRFARGLSDIASLALGNARRLSELERFHELVESLDAVFWEADPATMVFTFLGGRLDDILGAEAAGWPNQNVTWGSHIAAADREAAGEASRAAIDAGQDHTVEYRVITPRAARCGSATSCTSSAAPRVRSNCAGSWWTSPTANGPSRPCARASASTPRRSGENGKRPNASARSTT